MASSQATNSAFAAQSITGRKVSILNETNGKSEATSSTKLSIPESSRTASATVSSNSSSPSNGEYGSSNPSVVESNGTSMTSVAPSTHSSRDKSTDSGDKEDAFDSKQNQVGRENDTRKASSSASFDATDDGEPAKKRSRRESDSQADQTVQSRKMITNTRLARSPQPIKGDARDARRTQKDVANDEGSTGPPSGSAKSSDRKIATPTILSGGKKRYPCAFPGCEKTFSTSGHAARHNRIHTGSKPYRCTFPGCNASFSRQDNSLQHYRTHVLHPKTRISSGANMDRSKASESGDDLASLDPDTVATVQMGRKALEDGTAIAVVQEFIDGNGRKAEAVQRMVGQPRAGRRNSAAAPTTSQQAPPSRSATSSKWAAASQDERAEQHHRRQVSMESGRQYMHPNVDVPPPPQPQEHIPASYIHPQFRQPYGQEMYAEYGSHTPPPPPPPPTHMIPHHGPPPPPMQYPYLPPPPPPAVAYSGYYHSSPHAAYVHQDMRDPSPSSSYAMHGGEYYHGHMPPAPPPPHIVDDGYQGGYRRDAPRIGAYDPVYAASHSESHGRRSSVEVSHNHRRSASANHNNQYGGRSYDYYAPTTPYGEDAPSPQLSVRSFRSDGAALSLLSNTAAPLPPVRTLKRASLTSPIGGSVAPKSAGTSNGPSSPLIGVRSKKNDLHLPLPPLPAISKVPFSSDRSTNGMTPGATTTPLSEKVKAKHDREMGVASSPFSKDLPSFRNLTR